MRSIFTKKMIENTSIRLHLRLDKKMWINQCSILHWETTLNSKKEPHFNDTATAICPNPKINNNQTSIATAHKLIAMHTHTLKVIANSHLKETQFRTSRMQLGSAKINQIGLSYTTFHQLKWYFSFRTQKAESPLKQTNQKMLKTPQR